MMRARALLQHFVTDRGGIISVEMAFLSVFMVSLAVGLFDFGRYALDQSRVESAVRAGTQFAMRSASDAANTDAVEAAARLDLAGLADSFTVTARRYCACATVELACTQTCGDGLYAPMYAEVIVTGSTDLLFSYPGVQDPATVAAISNLRVR